MTEPNSLVFVRPESNLIALFAFVTNSVNNALETLLMWLWLMVLLYQKLFMSLLILKKIMLGIAPHIIICFWRYVWVVQPHVLVSLLIVCFSCWDNYIDKAKKHSYFGSIRPLAMFVDCFGHLLCTILGSIKSTSYNDANQQFPKIAKVSSI